MWVRAVCALLGMGSVTSLLAWGFGWGAFATWFWALSLPTTLALVVIALFVHRRQPESDLAAAFSAGALGGLLGTVAYDVLRIPFVLTGLRLFLPVDSFGILLLDERTSTPLTEFTGWAYHYTNGICFGVTYAMLAFGRRWWWGMVWGIFLETGYLVTPLGSIYQTRGNWSVIAVAYFAHLGYGAALGRIVENAGRSSAKQRVPVPAWWGFAALAAGLVLIYRPFSEPHDAAVGRALSAGPSAIVVGARFAPEWVRVPVGGCALIRDDDGVAYTLTGARGSPRLTPGHATSVCFDTPGVQRVRTTSEPYAGGVALVDPALSR